MSLINQMLADLEHRRGGQPIAAERALEGVYAASPVPLAPGTPVRTALRLALAVTLAIGVSGATWFGTSLIGAERLVASDARSRLVTPPTDVVPGPGVAAAALLPVAVSGEQHEPFIEAAILGAATAPARPAADAPVVSADSLVVAPGKPAPPASDQVTLPGAETNLVTDRAADAANIAVSVETIPVTAAEHHLSAESPVPASAPEIVERGGTVQMHVVAPGADPARELTVILTRLRDQGGAGVRSELARFVDRHPDIALAREALATDQIRAGERLAAEASLRAGLVLDPSAHRYALMLAHLEVDRGHIESAHDILQRALPGVAAHGEYLAFLAALKQRLARHDEATATYRQALDQEPERGAWWVGLGISLMAQEQSEAAQQAFARALVDSDLSDNLRRYATRELDRLIGRS